MTARQRLERAATRSRSLDERATEARRELWDAMKEARKEHMTLQEIADICGLSRQRVMEILRD
jgi:DNA-directed RNA polymerase sigma subunit (sigma70/sigma32)